MSPSLLIYAELLANIRQISVISSLPTPSSLEAKTNATLSPDGKQLTISHEGASATLNLPGVAAIDFGLPRPTLGKLEISWRIPLRCQTLPNEIDYDIDTAIAPWPSIGLSSSSKITCRRCSIVLVKPGAVTVWKDLPSENWAEMMDFWHCHKPSDPKNANHSGHNHANLTEKGYGANTTFAAHSGVGLVDLTYFLLSAGDCYGIKVRFIHLFTRASRRRPSQLKLSIAWPPIQLPKINISTTTRPDLAYSCL